MPDPTYADLAAPSATGAPPPIPASAGTGLRSQGGNIPAIWRNGLLVDETTGRLAYYGPQGQPGSSWNPGQPVPAGALTWQMPDGRWVVYNPQNFAYGDPTRVPNTRAAAAQTAGDARARLTAVLDQFGLGSLSEWAWARLVAGESETQILQELRQTQQYQTRFPGIANRQKAGLPAISEAEYLSYEATAISLMRAAGLPAGFYDQPSDFAAFIGADVALPELKDRIDMASQAALTAPDEVRQELNALYGIGPGDLTAYFLDPKRAEPILQRRFVAAQLGATSLRTGFGQVSVGEAERLASLGITPDQAAQGFGQLYNARELLAPLPGEAGGSFTRAQGLAATFEGDFAAREAFTRRAGQRIAEFGGTAGDFAASQQGPSGLGVAQGA